MSDEVILKKADGEFFAIIADLGVIERAPDSNRAYELAIAKKQTIEKAFSEANATHLLEKKNVSDITIRTWSTRLKKWMGISLALYFVGLLALGFVIKRSADRMITSFHHSVIDPDPTRVDKNVVKFRALLEKYRPFIEEWNKAFGKNER